MQIQTNQIQTNLAVPGLAQKLLHRDDYAFCGGVLRRAYARQMRGTRSNASLARLARLGAVHGSSAALRPPRGQRRAAAAAAAAARGSAHLADGPDVGVMRRDRHEWTLGRVEESPRSEMPGGASVVGGGDGGGRGEHPLAPSLDHPLILFHVPKTGGTSVRRVLLRAIRDVLVHGQVSQVPLLQGHTSPGLEPATPHSGEKRRVGHVGNEEVGGGGGGGGQRRMRGSPGETLGDLHLKDPALAVGFDSAGGREGRGGSGGYTLNHLPRTIVQGITPGFGYGLDEAKSPASRFFGAFAMMSQPISP